MARFTYTAYQSTHDQKDQHRIVDIELNLVSKPLNSKKFAVSMAEQLKAINNRPQVRRGVIMELLDWSPYSEKQIEPVVGHNDRSNPNKFNI